MLGYRTRAPELKGNRSYNFETLRWYLICWGCCCVGGRLCNGGMFETPACCWIPLAVACCCCTCTKQKALKLAEIQNKQRKVLTIVPYAVLLSVTWCWAILLGMEETTVTVWWCCCWFSCCAMLICCWTTWAWFSICEHK